MKKDKYELGSIELKDSVYISDPCYEVGIWCQAFITNLKPGRYLGFMYKTDTSWGRRVTDLWIVHEDYKDVYPDTIVEGADIGVDSGSAGIYDKEYYEKYHIMEEGKNIDDDPESAEWYEHQFYLMYDYDINGDKIVEKFHPEKRYFYTDQERRGGIALDDKCVISFSGYGDGGYPLFEAKNADNEVIGLRIEFIGEKEEDEDEE